MRTATHRVNGLQALFATIEREPWAWDFCQIMRRIDCLCADSPRFGTADLPMMLRLSDMPAPHRRRFIGT